MKALVKVVASIIKVILIGIYPTLNALSYCHWNRDSQIKGCGYWSFKNCISYCVGCASGANSKANDCTQLKYQ